MLDKSSKPQKFKGNTLPQEMSDFARLLAHIEENPWHYVAGAAFILFCMVAGFLFRLERMSSEQRIITQYAQALAHDDLEARIAALEPIANRRGHWGEEAQYMLGETALRARNYSLAEETFRALLSRNPKSEYAPQAMEAVAFIAENRGDLQAALDAYREVQERWGNTFTGRRQSLNVGRIQQELGNIEEAIKAYEEQQQLFPESFTAMQAEMALAELREDYPELFPEDEPEFDFQDISTIDIIEPEESQEGQVQDQEIPSLEEASVPVSEELSEEEVEAQLPEMLDSDQENTDEATEDIGADLVESDESLVDTIEEDNLTDADASADELDSADVTSES